MAEPLHWPDGQPVTPWADPWHDVAADLARIRERENLPYPGRFTPPPPDCPFTHSPQSDDPALCRRVFDDADRSTVYPHELLPGILGGTVQVTGNFTPYRPPWLLRDVIGEIAAALLRGYGDRHG